MKLSEFVKDYREDRKLSLRQMAEKCDCSFQYLSKLEKDEIEIPTMKMIVNLAKGMGMTAHELLSTVDDLNVYYDISYAPKQAPNSKGKPIPGSDLEIQTAYTNADERTQKMVRMLLGLEE